MRNKYACGSLLSPPPGRKALLLFITGNGCVSAPPVNRPTQNADKHVQKRPTPNQRAYPCPRNVCTTAETGIPATQPVRAVLAQVHAPHRQKPTPRGGPQRAEQRIIKRRICGRFWVTMRTGSMEELEKSQARQRLMDDRQMRRVLAQIRRSARECALRNAIKALRIGVGVFKSLPKILGEQHIAIQHQQPIALCKRI